jgi:hypothetical protein
MSTMNIVVKKGYSTDIHLFRTGQPSATAGKPPVGTTAELYLEGVTTPPLATTPVTSVPLLAGNVSFTYDTADSEVDTTQPYVRARAEAVAADNTQLRIVFELAPSAQLGETYCRVAYNAEGTPDYCNVLIRLTVHERLQRFWLGNRQLTLFNSPAPVPAGGYADERSVAVYAECLEAGTTTSVANLSGNSYLTYEPSKPEITCRLGLVRAQFDPALTPLKLKAKELGALRVLVGTKGAEVPPFSTTGADLPIYVKAGIETKRPWLRCVYPAPVTGAANTQKLRLLVLTDGFMQQADVDAWLLFVWDQLTNKPYNTPFDKLKDDLELWTVDMLSEDVEPGITQLSPLNQEGRPVPFHPIRSQLLPTYDPAGAPKTNPTTGAPVLALQKVDDPQAPGLKSIKELLLYVGLPTAAEAANANLASAISTWRLKYPSTSSAANSKGFRPTMVGRPLYDAWRKLVPSQFIYAKDTVFDLVKGTGQLREGRKSRLTRGDWAIGEDYPQFPLYRSETDKGRYQAILKSLTSADGLVTGAAWASDSTDALAAGVVCFIVHDPLEGGITIPLLMGSYSSTGGQVSYKPKPTSLPIVDIDFPDAAPQPGAGTANNGALLSIGTFVHELGHILGLGDEYGNVYHRHSGQLRLTQANANVDRFANIVTGNSLLTTNLAALTAAPGTGKITGKMLAPTRLKWNWDRPLLAAKLLADPQPVAQKATKTLRVVFDPLQDWTQHKGKAALVRPRDLPAGPIVESQLHAVVLENVTEGPDPADPCYLLEVSGSLPGIKQGDVVYIPQYYALEPNSTKRVKMQLITNEVAKLMQTKRFTLNDPALVDCAAANFKPQSPTFEFKQAMALDMQKRKVAGVVKNADNIIGLYEGGGEYDCGVYRSNGQSKMRRSKEFNGVDVKIYDYNYVSQYYIINKINPDKLADLDRTYDSKTR